MFEIFYNFYGWNQKLFVLINLSTNIGILPYFLQIITWSFFIGNFAVYYIVSAIYFYLKLQKISDITQRNLKFWLIYNELAKIGIIYVVFGLVYSLLKFSFNLPRPFCSSPPINFVTITDISTERCLSSFPSAHTGLALLIAYCIWSYLNVKQKLFAAGIVLMVGLSRITLAMHYPADILYSFLIIIFVIIIGNIIYRLLIQNLLKTIGNIINIKLFAN
ncbi:Phosphatase PAP2 family protein [Candidatus Trichorickettsia mobilis]|uniref:Phosphatase PAP2 family protein n=1 Tax=Candidatus Trichorickettsia mobilis TaxID=1346319 RepID=A0ABZ0UU04_9RICK|nr:phosphatase PAP2 family protein [Candidatus Trichorickettsia mobilis]WPY01066.1 Phosphatase PAP2 family protein [Candidatus Trichorickettsia mobilis]